MNFRNGFKRFTAVALSAALVMAPAFTSFAAEETTQGTGNILAYNINTVVVPTAIKLVINPNGYTVNTKYAEVGDAASYGATTKYYYKSDAGVYSVATDVTSAETFASKKSSLYTAVTSTEQVVSFNYGIASKATRDKTVTVRFDVTADSGIEFVEDADKIAPKANAEDTTGAPQDSHRIFLNLVPAKVGTGITAETKVDSDSAYASTVKFYKTDEDGAYVIDASITNADTLAAAKAAYTVYEDGTAIGKYIRGSELADVTMTKVDADDFITFEGEEGKGKAAADVAYMLYHATYDVKDDEFLDWDTSYEEVAGKFELTGIAQVSEEQGDTHNGGYSGFTFVGQMNTNTDWANLTTRTITIKPTYEIVNATGAEEAVDTGLNQVVAGERTEVEEPTEEEPTEAFAKVELRGSNNYLLVSPTADYAGFEGLTAVTGITSFEVKYNDGEYVDVLDIAVVSSQLVGVKYNDLKTPLGFESITTGDTLTAKVVIDGTTYVGVYTR